MRTPQLNLLLAQLRKESRVTQTTLAASLGVSRYYVSSVERGVKKFDDIPVGVVRHWYASTVEGASTRTANQFKTAFAKLLN